MLFGKKIRELRDENGVFRECFVTPGRRFRYILTNAPSHLDE